MSPHDVKLGGLPPNSSTLTGNAFTKVTTTTRAFNPPHPSRPSSTPSIANLINATMPAPPIPAPSVKPIILPQKNKAAIDRLSTERPSKRSKTSSPTDRSPPITKSKTTNTKSKDQQTNGPPNSKMAGLQNPKPPTSNSSGTSSPKPAVQRRAASPPRPQGNGLLSAAMFGVPGSSTNNPSFEIPTIVLDIPLDLNVTNTFNVQKLAEEKYGWAALNPKLAYRRAQDKLANAAANGSGKPSKRNSGEDMDVDETEDEDDNDNSTEDIASSGVDKPKKRRVNEEYDKDDPFIDDEEQIWEEQQASTKQGFFVYSGPLVPEGEKPVIEKAEGTAPKKQRASAKNSARGRGGAVAAGPKGARPRMSDVDTGTDQLPAKRKRRTRAEMEALRAEGKAGPVKRVNKPLPTLAARPEPLMPANSNLER